MSSKQVRANITTYITCDGSRDVSRSIIEPNGNIEEFACIDFRSVLEKIGFLFKKIKKSVFYLNLIFLFKSKSPTVLVWKHFYCATFHNSDDTLRKHNIILHNHRGMFKNFRTKTTFDFSTQGDRAPCNLTCIQFLFKPLEGLMLPLNIKRQIQNFNFLHYK